MRTSLHPPRPERVILGLPQWTAGSERCAHAAALACALRARGWEVRVLLTEDETPLVARGADAVPPPADLVVDRLRVTPHDGWAEAWTGVIRYLEERAPCVYLPYHDVRASCVSPRLSDRVHIVGLLHDDDALDYDHAARLGAYWNAVVAVSPTLGERLTADFPALAPRLVTIPAGEPEAMGERYLALFARVAEQARSGAFRRPQDPMLPPPAAVGDVPILPGHHAHAVRQVNALPRWPDARPVAAPSTAASVERPSAASAATPTSRAPRPGRAPLRDHRIVLAATSGRISGVDVFAINLARALRAQGFDAEIVRTSPDERVPDPLPLPGDVPVHQLALPPHPTWPQRWRAMRAYLERRGPCLYIPNYDWRHSGIAPTLPASVKVVGIAHSDDPLHYEHALRLAPYWDGLVAVSDAIAGELVALDPTLAPRLVTIPYGVAVPAHAPTRTRAPGAPLASVYTGRLARYQKRALDLPAIARALEARATPSELTVVGNGPDQGAFLEASAPLLRRRAMRYVGSLPNAEVLAVLAESDAFVLPSSFEGLPVSLLEAMAHGCVPVVAAVRSGVPALLRDGVNGFVVPVGAVDLFADRLARLEQDEALRRRMALAAYHTVRDGGYRTEDMTARYLALFEEIAARPTTRPRGPILPPADLDRLAVRLPAPPLPVRRLVWRLRATLRRLGL